MKYYIKLLKVGLQVCPIAYVLGILLIWVTAAFKYPLILQVS
jgi:hypothetical protein